MLEIFSEAFLVLIKLKIESTLYAIHSDILSECEIDLCIVTI